ncbi:MAG TPA: hypothetical protein VF008_19290 [Niastella sp.]
MKTTVSFFLLITVTLTSCEGFIHMQGHVYDSATKQPIDNSQILLILKRKDTVRDIYYEYDTVSYQKRMALRKAGIKDDYGNYAVGGLSKKATAAITDMNGKFTVGTILVPCVPKCPSCQLVFIKNGYKRTIVKLDSIVSDSMIVTLEKLADSISIRQ